MRVLPSWKSLGGVVRRQNRPNYLSEREGGSREEFRGPPAPEKICAPLRNTKPQTPITDHHTCVRSHVATRSHRPQGARAIPAPTGQSIPAQGSALGIRPRTFPHSNGTPQMVASPTRADTRARTMRRSFRAHPYAPSVPRMHTHHPCPRCMPTTLSPWLHPGLVCVAPLGQMESGTHICSRADPGTSPVRSREMRRASIGYNGATAGRRCGRRRGNDRPRSLGL